MGEPERHYPGVTEPVSLSGGDDKSFALTTTLTAQLEEYGLFEPEEEARHRERVLGQLNVIAQSWVCRVSMKKGMEERLAADVTCQIYTFGSFRLGVHGRGADIDTLLVGPGHITREDFFEELYPALVQDPKTTEIVAVPDAYVPVIKMIYDGIDIDLLFARLPGATIPPSIDLLQDKVLAGIDEKSVLSLNGVRVTDSVLGLVPEVPTFRIALRCMKKWAKMRGIYSNVIGYLGGVSWAILTARICQLYPHAPASVIVSRFFRVYEQWSWPNPVLLTHIRDSNVGAGRVWDPKTNPRERFHLMPVITPAYPSMNSTYNVSKSTLDIMKEEFCRGTVETFKIENQGLPWSTLFAPTNFFRRFKFYLQIDVCAADDENMKTWIGWCESRLRLLVARLERIVEVARIHPHPIAFPHSNPDQESLARLPLCNSFFFGLSFKPTNGKKTQVDLTPAVTEWTATVKERLVEDVNDIRVTFCKRSQLPSVVLENDPFCKELVAGKRKRDDPHVSTATDLPAQPTKKQNPEASTIDRLRKIVQTHESAMSNDHANKDDQQVTEQELADIYS